MPLDTDAQGGRIGLCRELRLLNPFASKSRRMLDVDVTYLEMKERPSPPPEAPTGATVLRAGYPSVAFYRYLYTEVGKRWLWYERRKLSDSDLGDLLSRPHIHIHVLYFNGVPAGYVEYDRSEPKGTEISYFGLISEFIGKGLGRFFVRYAVFNGWQADTERVWLHTCSLDHPRALGVYQSAGLVQYRRDRITIRDPRDVYDDLG